MPPWLILIIIGIFGDISAGFFGIGGGTVIVPALIYWTGFSQHMATGTSIAVLLPPIGLAAAFEYYLHGNVDIRSAIILANSLDCISNSKITQFRAYNPNSQSYLIDKFIISFVLLQAKYTLPFPLTSNLNSRFRFQCAVLFLSVLV